MIMKSKLCSLYQHSYLQAWFYCRLFPLLLLSFSVAYPSKPTIYLSCFHSFIISSFICLFSIVILNSPVLFKDHIFLLKSNWYFWNANSPRIPNSLLLWRNECLGFSGNLRGNACTIVNSLPLKAKCLVLKVIDNVFFRKKSVQATVCTPW